jgi:putative peptidoglycan lipid II flippase
MNRAVLFLTVLNFVAMAAGFLREAAIAYYFGTTAGSDAFAITLLFIESVAVVAGSGFGAYVMVPIVNRIFSERSGTEAFALMESLCLWLGVVSIPLALAAIFWPDALVNMLGRELSPTSRAQLVSLVRISIPSIPFLLASGVVGGVLQARADYFTPVLSRAVFSVVVAGFVIFGSSRIGVTAGSIGIMVGAVGQLAIQLPMLAKRGWVPALPSLRHPALSDTLHFGLPALTAMAFANIILGNGQRFLAFGLPEGSLAAIGYAQRILSLLANLSLAIGTVSLTRLSAEYSANGLDQSKTAHVLERAIKNGLFLLTPLSILVYAYSYPITAALYQRGQFGSASVALTAECVKWFTISIIPGLVLAVVLRAYAALWRPWSNTWVSIFWCVSSLVATAWLLPTLQTIAIPAAFFIGTSLAAIVSILGLRNVLERSFFTSLVQYTVQITVCGAVSAAVLLALRGSAITATSLTLNSAFQEIAAIAAFSAVFTLTCMVCRDPHLSMIWSLAPVVRIRKQIHEWL